MKEALCPVLRNISEDVFDLAREIIPILLVWAVEQKHGFSMDPVLLSTFVVLLSKVGVAKWCGDLSAPKQEVSINYRRSV